jgi:ribosomal protein L11 methyltransferase
VSALWDQGTDGVEMLGSSPGTVCLVAYFPDSDGLDEAVASALSPFPGARVEPTVVAPVDWVQRFREGFRPFSCGGFWIAPTWQAHLPPPDGLRLLQVDPGRAFGTGTHETTRLCMSAIEGASPPAAPDQRMLDVGSGTGILAVAALLLGWRRAVAVDIDEEAVAASGLHGALNHVAVTLVRGDGAAALADRAFHLVVANLTAPLLLERRDELLRVATPGGLVVLSGLLASDLDAVIGRYAGGGAIATQIDGEWASVRVRRPL